MNALFFSRHFKTYIFIWILKLSCILTCCFSCNLMPYLLLPFADFPGPLLSSNWWKVSAIVKTIQTHNLNSNSLHFNFCKCAVNKCFYFFNVEFSEVLNSAINRKSLHIFLSINKHWLKIDSEECPGSLVVYLDDYLYPSPLNPSLPFQATLTIYFLCSHLLSFFS